MNVICTLVVAISFVPSGAGISIPLWNVEATVVGAILFPNEEERVV